MSGRSNYSTLVANAEKAVGGVKDPELKRVAFQTVLEDMLKVGSVVGSAKRGLAVAGPEMSTGRKKAGGSKMAGPQIHVEGLVTDGFFKKAKTIGQVKTQLENSGHNIPVTSLSGPLQILCQRRVLRRQRIPDDKGKRLFAYSNW